MNRWQKRAWRLGASLLLAWVVIYYLMPLTLSIPAALQQPARASVEITDRHGHSLRRPLSDGQRVEKIKFTDLPPALVEATIAAEDQRFWSHGGIDFIGSLRALTQAFRAQKVISGASTLTQQLVKVAHGRYEKRTWKDKLREMAYARKIEMTWSKERVLTEYFQRVNYGNQSTGIGAAAAFYFQKPLADLSLAECALLAGLPQAPTRLNPLMNLDAAKKRQSYVLNRMTAQKFITSSQATAAKNETLRLQRWTGGFSAPHFVDYYLQRSGLEESESIRRTTLDLELQQTCERLLKYRLAQLKDQQVRDGAIMVLDNRTGGILAMVGSPDYFSSNAGQVNGATAARSAGSTLKPFTYALAMESGDSPATVVDDMPMEFITPTGVYQPKNYDERAYGPMPYREALANSLNLSAVKVLQRLGGPDKLYNFLQAAGMTTLTKPADFYGLGLTIGNAEVTLLELAQVYSCLARLGEWKPVVIDLKDENSISTSPRLLSPESCWLIADILSDPQARSRTFGLESPLRLPFPAAVKTGTSTNFRDNWCVGYTPEFTVAVWMGNFDQQPMNRVSGVTGSAPLWREIMLWLEKHRGVTWYPALETIVALAVDPLTGLRVPSHLRDQRRTVLEKFSIRNIPPIADSTHYDDIGRVRLPLDYQNWLTSDQNWLGSQAVVSALAPSRDSLASSSLRIVSPLSGATFILDPDLSHGGQLLPLITNDPQSLHAWSSQTLAIEQRGGKAYARLKPGKHEIRLRHSSSDVDAVATITVRAL